MAAVLLLLTLYVTDTFLENAYSLAILTASAPKQSLIIASTTEPPTTETANNAAATNVATATRATQAALKAKVLRAVRLLYSKQERPMVVFNLDGAIFDHRSRMLKILKEYAESELKLARPEQAKVIAKIKLEQIKYGLEETLRAAGISEKVIISNAAVFWEQRFFTDEYLQYDTPVAGVVKFIRALYTTGARIVYLTNRDAMRQLIGSVRQLRDLGLPIGLQSTELIMRPTTSTPEVLFQQQVTHYLRQYGTVVAIFDSETSSLNNFYREFPHTMCFLVDFPRATNHPPLMPGVVTIDNFK
jgi:hypothetical protein